MITADSSLEDVAFEVCTILANVGITAVLSGGGAATIYSRAAMQSFDCDFIVTITTADTSAGNDALLARGFRLMGETFVHDLCPAYGIEFPSGPLAVGDELITMWETCRRGNQILHIIAPTDSVRDRLAAFYHWNDRSALEAAALVTRAQPQSVNLRAIRKWSIAEGAGAKWLQFKAKLS